jgi:hypothetical protein
MGEMRNACNLLVGKSARRNYLGQLGIDVRIILE